MCLCLYVRLKSVISSDNQENLKSDNAAFFQILISFYIQSEVDFPLFPLVLSLSLICFSLCLK